jgi:hypothetical protein
MQPQPYLRASTVRLRHYLLAIYVLLIVPGCHAGSTEAPAPPFAEPAAALSVDGDGRGAAENPA